jgi:hypothetical protein
VSMSHPAKTIVVTGTSGQQRTAGFFRRTILALGLVASTSVAAGCSAETSDLPESGESDSVAALAAAAPIGKVCDESSLDQCIRGGGGATCITRHCESEVGDDVCASELAKVCLRGGGGIGCKKYCGHPIACYRKKGVFSCDRGGCRCLDPGVAEEDPIGNFLIELVGSAGLSLARQLATKLVRSSLTIAAERASLSAVSAFGSSLDDSFGTAFTMGARGGLRLSAHPHELVNGTIRVAPDVASVSLRALRTIKLPALGTRADNWIWLVDDGGRFLIAPEVKLAARQTLGHPTLCGGCSARIAGEIIEETGPDNVTRLVINNQSGRYFQDFDHGAEHLQHAAEVLQAITGRPTVARYVDF